MSWLGLLLNAALIAGAAIGIRAWWVWRERARARRFRLEPPATPKGRALRATRWILESLVALELALAIANAGVGVSTFGDAVSGASATRLLIALDLVLFASLLRSDVFSHAAFFGEDAIFVGWGAAARYADVQSIEWLGSDLLALGTAAGSFVFRVADRDRESLARFLGEKTGKVVSAPSASR